MVLSCSLITIDPLMLLFVPLVLFFLSCQTDFSSCCPLTFRLFIFSALFFTFLSLHKSFSVTGSLPLFFFLFSQSLNLSALLVSLSVPVCPLSVLVAIPSILKTWLLVSASNLLFSHTCSVLSICPPFCHSSLQ